jgi:hypothetical protein
MSTQSEVDTSVTPKQDQFFGIKTEIKRPSKDDETPEITITDDEGTPAPKAAKPKPVKQTDEEELATYSEGVQKRIKKMRWQQGEVERERDGLRAERDEAFRVAQNLYGTNQQYQNTINTGEARLVSEIKQRSENDVKIAKAAYASAYEKGDTAAIIEAQELMLNANADLRSANQYETEYKGRQQPPAAPQQQQYKPQPAPVQRQVPSVPKPTEEASTWAEENPWFGDPDHADMTALAYGVHERLIKHDGIKPDTPEYFDTINAEMRQRFPEKFAEEEGTGKPAPTPRKTPATVVGSGRRDTAKKSRKVVLHASQVRLAKRLGLTVEQYAAQLIREGN